jgi:hypothetical protein
MLVGTPEFLEPQVNSATGGVQRTCAHSLCAKKDNLVLNDCQVDIDCKLLTMMC